MHNDFVAHRKIEIAQAKAREAYLLEQQKAMTGNTADARLASRTAEADAANQRTAALTAELAALNAKPSPRGLHKACSPPRGADRHFGLCAACCCPR